MEPKERGGGDIGAIEDMGEGRPEESALGSGRVRGDELMYLDSFGYRRVGSRRGGYRRDSDRKSR
jgi:hypothetical protein